MIRLLLEVHCRRSAFAKASADRLMPGEINVDACPWLDWPCSHLLFVAACGSPSPQPSSAPATPEPAAAPAAPPPLPGESTITGSVKYEGTAEKPRVVRMDSDPLCMPEGPTTSEVLIVGPGNGLQNAFVYVKDGLGDRNVPGSADAGRARPEGLQVLAARLRGAGRPAGDHPQQRPHAPQRPRGAEGQRRVQLRPGR